jgi:hypothetical protein
MIWPQETLETQEGKIQRRQNRREEEHAREECAQTLDQPFDGTTLEKMGYLRETRESCYSRLLTTRSHVRDRVVTGSENP